MAAAAALGHSARRLGGSGALRQTQEAAVSRLSPRFAHTEAQPNCVCGKFETAKKKLEKHAVFKGIQKQADELYEAAAMAHEKYGMDEDSACRMNRALLRKLTDHVCRRSSGDPIWEWARRSQARHDVIKAAGYVTMALGWTNLSIQALAWAVQDYTHA